jgi:hypothetical protein
MRSTRPYDVDPLGNRARQACPDLLHQGPAAQGQQQQQQVQHCHGLGCSSGSTCVRGGEGGPAAGVQLQGSSCNTSPAALGRQAWAGSVTRVTG